MFAGSACQAGFALGVVIFVGGFVGESSAANLTLEMGIDYKGEDRKFFEVEYTEPLQFLFILGEANNDSKINFFVGECREQYLPYFDPNWPMWTNITVYKDKKETGWMTGNMSVEKCDPKIEKVGGKEKVKVQLSGRIPKNFQVVALNTKIFGAPEIVTTTADAIISTIANTVVNTTASLASLLHVPIGLIAANVLGLSIVLFS